MAAIDGIVFAGIDPCPYASVKLMTPSGHCVAEQTATSTGEFKFVVPNGVWGIEAAAGDHTIAVRDVMAMEGERLPVYVRLDNGERMVPRHRVIDITDAALASEPKSAPRRIRPRAPAHT